MEKLFRAPGQTWPDSDKGQSLLFHLREDLVQLYGPETQLSGKPMHGVFLPISGMCSGLDCIAKAYSTKARSGDRFVEVAKDLGGLDDDRAEALYQLRNALTHEFSLDSISTRPPQKDTKYRFRLDDADCATFEAQHGSPIVLESEMMDNGVKVRTYRVSYWGIKKLFLSSIANLQAKLHATKPDSGLINRLGMLAEKTIIES